MLAAAYQSLGRVPLAWPLRTPTSLFKVQPTVAILSRSCRHQLSTQPCLSMQQHYSTTSDDRQTNQQNQPVLDNTRIVFFFDIDNCLYPKSSGIPNLMKARIEQYFRDSGIPHDEVERLANRYYIEYGLAIRGLVEKHPEIDIRDYDNKVDGALPLENILHPNLPLREMIQAMNVGKKWLFTNAGENHAKRVIKVLGLEGLFHGMTFCNYLEPKFVCKPDQKSFEKAMKEAGVSDPAQCFFVDDSASNVEMATKLGWTAVHVLEDPAPLSSFSRLQIQSVLDLPSVVPRFWEPVRKTELQSPEQPQGSTTTESKG